MVLYLSFSNDVIVCVIKTYFVRLCGSDSVVHDVALFVFEVIFELQLCRDFMMSGLRHIRHSCRSPAYTPHSGTCKPVNRSKA